MPCSELDRSYADWLPWSLVASDVTAVGDTMLVGETAHVGDAVVFGEAVVIDVTIAM